MRRSTIQELATRANVSVTTVSRVFNGHPHTNPNTIERVKKIAREINYIPKGVARRQRVAVILPKFEENRINNYTSSLLLAIGQYCSENGIHFQIITSDCLNLLDEYYIDCAISLTSRLENVENYSNTKFIYINTIPPGAAGVRSENYKAIKKAVQYLADYGRKRQAIVLPLTTALNVKERIAAFNKAINEVGLQEDECAVIELPNHKEFEVFSKHVRRIKADGIIIGGENMSLTANYYLSLLNLKVPEDVSLISFEAPNFSEFLTPPHTTIKQNFEQMVKDAFKMLDAAMKCKLDKNANIVVPCEFIERESVARLK
jgi:LacI family transcriptional regulator